MSTSPAKSVAPRVHLVSIGNELLNGETRDTNLAWMIKWFTRRGGDVVRAVMIPDDFNAIRGEIESAKSRRIDLLITTGGLGPSDDDATLAAIGKSLDLDLELDQTALDMIRDRMKAFRKLRPGLPRRLTKERRGMAMFPKGSTPLRNPAGVAPGMMYRTGGLTIVALPGVPGEMRSIVRVTLIDFWRDFFKGLRYVRRNIVLKGIPEAELTPFVRKVSRTDPGVYVKSHLKTTRKSAATIGADAPEKLPWELVLHFSVTDSSVDAGRSRIDRLIELLVADLKKKYRYPLHVDL